MCRKKGKMTWLPIGGAPRKKAGSERRGMYFVLQSKGNVAGEAKPF